MNSQLIFELQNIIDTLKKKSNLTTFAVEVSQISKKFRERREDPTIHNILEELKSTLKQKAEQSGNQLSTSEILSLISAIQLQHTKSTADFFVPEGKDAVGIPRDMYALAMDLAEHLHAKKEVEDELSAEQDEGKINNLKHELEMTVNGIKDMNRKVEALKIDSPTVYDAIKRYINYAVNKVGPEFIIVPER